MNKLIYSIALSCLISTSYSQKNAVKSNYYTDYLKAERYINEEKFEDAQDLLEEIPEQDSLYLKAQYKLQLMYSRSENYPKVIEIGERMTNLPFESGNRVFDAWAHSLVKMEKFEEALEVVDLGLEKFSESHLLYFRRGLILQELDRHQEAFHSFQRAIQAYPLHVNSHVALGEMAAHEGRYTQALMSLSFASIFANNPNYQSSIHITMENISTMDFENEPKGIQFDEGDDFSNIDQIIETRIALSKKFKLQSKLTMVNYTRQLQVIMEALRYDADADADGFWMQHYAPLFTGIYSAKLFDAFTYVTLIGPNYGKISAPAYKQKKRVGLFFTWLKNNVGKYIARQVIEFDGKKQEAFIDLGPANIVARGLGSDYDDRNGTWELFNGVSGRPIGVGPFKDGKRHGEWVIYDESTGLLYQKLNFVDGDLNGVLTFFYENGNPEVIVNMKNDERDGQRIIFFPSGDTMMIDNHVMGKRTGDFTRFHQNNTVKVKGYLKDDKWEGELKEYHTNGTVSAELIFKDDKKDGAFSFYFRNGQLSEKGTYKMDKKVDEYESYYNNGQLESKGRYKNDNQVGKWVSYYYDGKLKQEVEFDDNGKKNAISKTYDRDGKIHHEMEYKSGELLSYKFFNKDGKIIAQEKKSGKKLNYKFYDPRGILIVEGQLVSDEKTGKWIEYNENGVKEAELTYDKGKINGKSKIFFPNGEIQIQQNYVDDELDGLIIGYHENGEIKVEGYFAKGNRTGMWYYYYQDGTLSDKEYYVDGEAVSWSEDYSVKGLIFTKSFNEDGDITKTIYFDVAGNPLDTIQDYHGEITVPNPNGKDILAKRNFKNGVRHGLSESYYMGTRVNFTGEFFNGRRNGLFVDYYPNGQKNSETNYVHGQITGVVTEYRWNGKISSTASYKDGVLDGEAIYYHPDGSLHYKMNYIDNAAHGEVVMKLPSGETYAVFYYDNSALIGYSYTDKNGNLKDMIELDKDEKIVCYYKNGTKSLEAKLVNGEFEGTYIVYDTKGKMFEQKTYVSGNLDGVLTFSSAPEKVYSTISYAQGQRHGEMKINHLNGNIFVETNYHYGLKNGTEKEYDQNGKLKFTREYYNGVLISEKKH